MDPRLEALRDSFDASAPLREGQGCVVYERFPESDWLEALHSEVRSLSDRAQRQDVAEGDADDVRGGTPRRSLLTVEGGPQLKHFYADPSLTEVLSEQCGAPLRPRGPEGSYSLYVRPGDHLGLHRDMEECDVAFITVLEDTAPPGDGGTLVVYRGRCDEPLASIRARPDYGAEAVHARPGQSILLAGGLVPHCVTPTAAGQVRIISALCFQVDRE